MTAAMLYAFAALTRPSPAPSTVPGANIFTSAFILSIGIWAPVLTAFVIGVLPNPRGRYDTLIKQIAFFTNLIVLFILFVAYNQFQNFLPTLQYEENWQWLPAIGAAYHLGVDGRGILMLMLSALVGIFSVLASTGIRTRVRSYFALLLLAQSCVTGAIAAHDPFVLVAAAPLPTFAVHGWDRDVYWHAAVGVVVLLGRSASRLRHQLLRRLPVPPDPVGAQFLEPLQGGLAALTVLYSPIAGLRSTG